MTSAPNLSPDAFSGTAEAYARFRPPYPQALIDDLMERTGKAHNGRLLDLACGPGRVALAMAHAFDEVWANDLESEMLEVGKLEAARRGVSNVRWLLGRAEDVDAPSVSFDLVTIGDAFHRLDQARVVEKALRWLKPGGHIAILGSDGILNAHEAWQKVVTELAQKRSVRAFPNGWAPGAANQPSHQESILRQAGFADITAHTFSVPYTWTIDSIIGYLRSTSVCSNRILGDDAAAFDAELTAKLFALDARGIFSETISFGYTLARKHG